MPATKYDDGKQLVIFRPDSTVMIFSDDPARVERFGNALVQGPAVLTELAQFGVVFDPDCLTVKGYCVARRNFAGDFDVTVNLSPAADIPPWINIGGAKYPYGHYSGSGTGAATFVRPDGTVETDSQMDFALGGDYSTKAIYQIHLQGLFTGTQRQGGASFTGRSTIGIDDISRQTGKAKFWVEGQPSSTLADFDLTYGSDTSGNYGIVSIRLRGKFVPLSVP